MQRCPALEYRIADKISRLPACRNPLSSDVGLIRGDRFLWLFDVGASPDTAREICSLPGEKAVILSHFHADHSANLAQIQFERLYAGAYACKKFGMGTPVDRDILVEDGISLHLFPLPSSHAKGCVGLEINGEYAFVGDGLYGAFLENDRQFYNVSLLHDEIRTLKSLSAEYLLLSHDKKFLYSRQDLLFELQEIYKKRQKDNPNIYL